MTLKEIKKLLKKYNIRPSRRLGQNFLISELVLEKIIEAANLSKDDIVLEVGPGIGNLTIKLAKRVKKVIAVEKDQKMIKILKKVVKNLKNVKIIKGDILKIFEHKRQTVVCFLCKGYKVVANIPYYLTSPLIKKFLETVEVKPQQMVLMIQKEVAQRICAKPPDMNLLAISVQFYAKPEITSYVSKKSFWPQPKVDSAIIKIVPRPLLIFKTIVQNISKEKFRNLFFKVVRIGFLQPRKQLINNLSKGLKIKKKRVKNWLLENEIKPTQRAETLTIEDWIKLTKSIKIH